MSLPGSRPVPVIFLAWTRTPGRAREIAGALGGEAVTLQPQLGAGLPRLAAVATRYAVSLAMTVVALERARPQAVVVTNPPIVPVLAVAAWSRVRGARFCMDSHPTAFGLKGHTVSQRLAPVHRWLARRAAAVLVTTEERARVVASWGGNGLVVHEAVREWDPERQARLAAVGDGPGVLFVGTFGGDEPVTEVVEAARLLPGVRVSVTGDLARCPAGLREGAPEDLRFVGYLGPQEYLDAVGAADVVLTLTTEPSSVMRSAYEAVYAGRPLVVSDTPVLRELFPSAVFVQNTPEGIAAGVAEALARRQELTVAAVAARDAQVARWNDQLGALRRACGLV